MAETPEQKYNRIAAAVQQTILNNFPNPNRVGCPGEVRLREVAARGTLVEDDDWQHITHCSECYREFLAVKEEIRRAGRRARTLGAIGGTALLLLIAGAVAYRYLGESRGASGIVAVAFEPATLNLRDSSDTRGDRKDVERNIPVLPRRPLELKIILPFGSESGPYQFQFIDSGGRVVQSGEGTAAILKGDTFFTTRFDAGRLAAGAYEIGLRQQSFTWAFFSFRVQ
jgi:hypothetical protein